MEAPNRKRLGLLVPAQNIAVEQDFSQWAPHNICLHSNRLYIPSGKRRPLSAVLQAMNEHLEEAARLLAKAPVDVVAFACTSGSFTEGIAYDREIQHRIESATGGLRVLTAAASALEALREMSAQKVSVVAPYPPQVNEQLLAFLSEAGFDVVAFESCNPHAAVIDSISPSAISEVVMNIANRARPDAIFVSCTALSTATVIDKLESATGKAVITSNQALFWQCMRALDHSKPIFGGGALLRNKIPVGASR